MNIPLAISKLTTLHSVMEADTDPGFLEAIKLGIEALKHLEECWEAKECERIYLLPGETED